MREAIFGLRHLASPGPEFLPALEEYLNEYRTYYGLQVQLVHPDGCRPYFSDQVTAQLTRIIQEALTNIRKHALTNQARIQIEQIDHQWRVTVEDDGQGFDPHRIPKSAQQFLGLQIMRERAASIGAELEVNSRPGGGTSVILRLPLASENPNGRTFTHLTG
ncbi:MAG: hypothetical protein A2Z03_07220 [Chloroflexi bacterium RBG_16_56_8]|nr:MAG: hypothetical protein A2Z03_07220 [Chloroflexi bacterium RBG_16_56_8]